MRGLIAAAIAASVMLVVMLRRAKREAMRVEEDEAAASACMKKQEPTTFVEPMPQRPLSEFRRTAPLRRVRIPGDGNCLFRALAYPRVKHASIRRRVVEHMRRHWHEVYRDHVPDDAKDTYLSLLAMPGQWGDELCLRAYSDMIRAPVVVYCPSAQHVFATYGASFNRRRTRRVLYNGRDHYDVLLRVNDIKNFAT